ncbi:MAG TPA: ATP-binding domain-containing protein [Oligoflexia bacterium]|nr:ATP-binding domain-containing protein [Oligoflexia bacterium]HMP27578.1 ATP-binding domain-containing protein [Oligoflexia bacterium]
MSIITDNSSSTSNNTSNIDYDTIQIILEEQRVLKETITNIEKQIEKLTLKLNNQEDLSRYLTADILTTRKTEDKAQKASDEAVAHGRKKISKEELAKLTSQLEKPYFARVILSKDIGIEEKENTSINNSGEIEFKIGHSGNSECRIVDWKKAPLAKIYYEYPLGAEVSEFINNKEVQGTIKLRRTLEIANGRLVGLTCERGAFKIDQSGEWIQTKNPRESILASSQRRDRLPEILSLITKEQFQAITTDSNGPVIIKGIAGSGKTTVGLYRLAWQIENSPPSDRDLEIMIVTDSPLLAKLIKNSLEQFGISKAKVYSNKEALARVNQTNALPIGYLLIDEAQDLEIDQVLKLQAPLKELSRLTIVGDEQQNWHNNQNPISDIPAFKKLLIEQRISKENNLTKDQSFQITSLLTNHRSNLSIIKLANFFSKKPIPLSGRNGAPVFLLKHKNEESSFINLTRWLNATTTKSPDTLTAIICKSKQQAKNLHSLLVPNFGEQLDLITSEAPKLRPAGIIVIDCASAKGTEFLNVAIWDANQSNFPKNDPQSRRMLYTAITRAEENLLFFNWDPSTTIFPTTTSEYFKIVEIS